MGKNKKSKKVLKKESDETQLPIVTVGIVNCNRLFYLKSCLESFLECTDDYPNREIIIVDNASTEEGTEEYLSEKAAQGIRVIRMEKRDPSNEFPRALNTIVKESKGEYVLLLQGDMQFIIKDKWLHRYVELYQKSKNMIGCICLDAQRSVTHSSHRLSEPAIVFDYGFVADHDRSPISGAGDVMYSRDILEKLGPWSEENSRHEGNDDSETKMLKRIKDVCFSQDLQLTCVLPIFPPSIAIYTDARGTNARVRNHRRYGDYWAPKEGHKYYEIYDFDSIVSDGKTSRNALSF